MKARLDILGRRDEILSYISDNYSKVEIARELDCKMPTFRKVFKKTRY